MGASLGPITGALADASRALRPDSQGSSPESPHLALGRLFKARGVPTQAGGRVIEGYVFYAGTLPAAIYNSTDPGRDRKPALATWIRLPGCSVHESCFEQAACPGPRQAAAPAGIV